MNKEHWSRVRSRRDVFPLELDESKFARIDEKKFASVLHRKKKVAERIFLIKGSNLPRILRVPFRINFSSGGADWNECRILVCTVESLCAIL